MKKFITLLSVAAVAVAMSPSAVAADEKKAKKKRDPNAPRTITGVGVCGKCSLGTADKCNNVVKVTFKGKDGKSIDRVFTLADNDVAKGAHGKFFCKGETPVAVTGTIKREGRGKDMKLTITASKVGAPKKKGKKKKDA